MRPVFTLNLPLAPGSIGAWKTILSAVTPFPAEINESVSVLL
jgi:hypothetical protein